MQGVVALNIIKVVTVLTGFFYTFSISTFAPNVFKSSYCCWWEVNGLPGSQWRRPSFPDDTPGWACTTVRSSENVFLPLFSWFLHHCLSPSPHVCCYDHPDVFDSAFHQEQLTSARQLHQLDAGAEVRGQATEAKSACLLKEKKGEKNHCFCQVEPIKYSAVSWTDVAESKLTAASISYQLSQHLMICRE